MRTVIHTMVLSLAVVLFTSVFMIAQVPDPPLDGEGQPRRQQGDQRPNLLRQLGLSPAQVRQVRQYNMRRRPLMEQAQRRFRDANRRLDEAIYAEQLNEAEVQNRIKELQLSQAELIRLRSMSELSLRKILTPEQLNRFRRLRQRYNEATARPGRQAVNLPVSEEGPPPPPVRRRK